MIGQWDRAILLFCNQLAGRSERLDGLVMFASHNGLVKGGLCAVLLWWFWFRVPAARARPVDTPDLPLHASIFQSQVRTLGWSSFPSDHAAFFFTLAAGLFLISRRAGILAMVHTAVFICLPRLYLGIHYPSDLLAGAAIGVVAALLANRETVRRLVAGRPLAWFETTPSWFYVGAFLFTYQVAEVFDQSLEFLFAAASVVKVASNLFR
jgi:undecaprenyl-diphosphatase